MSTTPADAILIQGSVDQTPPPAGYIRFDNAGQRANFLDIPTLAILTPVNPQPDSRENCLVDVGAQFRFSDYPAPIPLPVGTPVGRPVPPRKPAGLYGNDGTPLVPPQMPGQVAKLSGQSTDGFTYSLSLDPFSLAATQPVTGSHAWAGVCLSLAKTTTGDTSTRPPVLQFGISYNPLQSQFGVFIQCNNVILSILATMEFLYQQEETTVVAVLKRSLTYYDQSFGDQTINMDGNSTDPEIYLPIAGILWPYTNLFGFFAPALAYIASQTGDTLPEPQSAPLSTLAHLQYLYNPGLKYPPAWTLQQFITNATAQIGPLLGPFAAEFLPPGDSGIQPWIDAARWMGWVLMEGAGKPALTTALTAQYDFWKNYVPSGGGKPNPLPIDKALPVQQAGVKGQHALAGEPGTYKY